MQSKLPRELRDRIYAELLPVDELDISPDGRNTILVDHFELPDYLDVPERRRPRMRMAVLSKPARRVPVYETCREDPIDVTYIGMKMLREVSDLYYRSVRFVFEWGKCRFLERFLMWNKFHRMFEAPGTIIRHLEIEVGNTWLETDDLGALKKLTARPCNLHIAILQLHGDEPIIAGKLDADLVRQKLGPCLTMKRDMKTGGEDKQLNLRIDVLTATKNRVCNGLRGKFITGNI